MRAGHRAPDRALESYPLCLEGPAIGSSGARAGLASMLRVNPRQYGRAVTPAGIAADLSRGGWWTVAQSDLDLPPIGQSCYATVRVQPSGARDSERTCVQSGQRVMQVTGFSLLVSLRCRHSNHQTLVT